MAALGTVNLMVSDVCLHWEKGDFGAFLFVLIDLLRVL